MQLAALLLELRCVLAQLADAARLELALKRFAVVELELDAVVCASDRAPRALAALVLRGHQRLGEPLLLVLQVLLLLGQLGQLALHPQAVGLDELARDRLDGANLLEQRDAEAVDAAVDGSREQTRRRLGHPCLELRA